MEEKKKSRKEVLAETKINLAREIRNKKRWGVCGIETAIVLVLIIVDLLTKKYVYGACLEQGKIDIIAGVLSLVPVQNTGASFGMLSGQTQYLTVVSFISGLFLFFFIFYSYNRRNLWLRSSLILITAGAFGNVIDRITLGYVRDFIYFELIDFAVFNFADSCLTVGTIVLIIYIVFFYSKEEEEIRKKKLAAAKAQKEDTKTQETEVQTAEVSQDTAEEENGRA